MSTARVVLARILRRRVDHWTPQYLFRRAQLYAYERRHPEAPWLTAGAIQILSTALRPTDKGLEWGSGRSTLWLAARTSALLSIDSSADWFERISEAARRQGLLNLDYRFVPQNERRGDMYSYVAVASDLEQDSLDYVLVDGLYRAECATVAVRLVKRSGFLILDDAERYLPLSPGPPEGRQSPPAPEWHEFSRLVSNWRLVWTSDGVSGTALWIRAG